MSQVAGAFLTDPSRRGHAIQTYSGGRFYPFDPRQDEIKIDDIAHALSLQCRFAGHCLAFYSVAEHCVRVSDYLLEQSEGYSLAFLGLMHDASEAYLIDLPRPIKRWEPFSQVYLDAEAAIEQAIAQKFGLTWPWDPRIKQADNILLATEYRDLMKQAEPWQDMPAPLREPIKPYPWQTAKHLFLNRFWGLTRALETEAARKAGL